MVLEDVIKKELGNAMTCDVLVGCDEVCLLAETVDNDEDGVVMARSCGEASDEVEGEVFPFALGDWKGFKEALREQC